MENIRIPIGEWVDVVFDWFKENLDWLFDFFTFLFRFLIESLTEVLVDLHPLVIMILLALIGWVLRSWQMAVGTLIAMFFVMTMDQWVASMQTLALIIIAALIAIVIAIPVGILAARNDTVSAVVRPILDFMQTMPAFVYLIPAVTFFSIGVVPGLVSTVIFALPPGVRFTELGIRGVDSETVEAGQAFGATPGQILRGVQLPLATPTIMAGINQVIMLALAMAVIAGFVGADGLGKNVVEAVATQNLPLGVEAGLGVVIIAVYLDRVTAALGTAKDYPNSLLGKLKRRNSAQAEARSKAEADDAAKAAALAHPAQG
ncbi:glycine betaine/proline transport system permease protein [Brevibacterium sanguinis]|uniref:Glycine betaine/proline transport system permease protein n=2 Tax=Brevibacterium TaxID=1696 RepID=A0A366IM84_9MICO|nr:MULTISPECIES: ABC transporter permease subunit [Brevibacterium]RBP67077.1 glycine betaine/proline transport system permease protein [Brevibacterium sanguinis]RBP73602.1 glycine betaine/proline transport system permease protein [Brevibacterium celere]